LKKKFTAVVLFLAAMPWGLKPLYGQSGGAVLLDEAIQNSALQIQNRLDRGSTVIVYQFQSHNARISDYVLKELFDKLINVRKFTVLDRDAQKVIDAELDFQYKKSAGMISDESLASLTRRIGAAAIVTGSLDDAGNEYRFRIRVIGTETAAAIASYAVSVNKKDKRIATFSKGVGEKIGTGALNILLGLGSYLEGDILGGLTLTAGYAVAAGLFITEVTVLDRDSPIAGLPATVGAVAAGLTVAYGFARPFIYNRSPSLASVTDNAKTNIVLTSDAAGNRNAGFQFIYKIKF
jgi:TolB-like protein